MKREKITFFCFLSVILLLVGCHKDNDPIAVSDVTLNKPVIELTVGEAAHLTTTVTPAADRTVIWSTDNARHRHGRRQGSQSGKPEIN